MVLKGRPLKMDFVLLLLQFIRGSEITHIRTFRFGSRRGYIDERSLFRCLRQHQVGKVMVRCGTCLFVLVTWQSVKRLVVLKQTMRIQRFYIADSRSSRRRGPIIWYQLIARRTFRQWISVVRKCRRVQKVCEQFLHLLSWHLRVIQGGWLFWYCRIMWMLVSIVHTKA